MWIKKQEKRQLIRDSRFKWISIVIISLLLLFLIYLASVYTVARYKHHLLLMTVSSHLKTPVNYLKSLTVIPERMDLDISFENVERLRKQSSEAKNSKGFMETFRSDTSYVPISVTYNGEKYNADARLKGNWWDARVTSKWSLRINLDGDGRIKGMKRFSIHSPLVKGFMTEWIFQKLAQREEILGLHYDFLSVVINGEHGIYAMEEQIDLDYPEKNKLPQSVIIKFDEYWMYRAMLKDYENVSDEDMEILYPVSPIEAVQMGKVKDDPQLMKQFAKASNLLNGFRSKKLKASEVFVLKDIATLFAIADLFGHPHNVEMRNVRFYYNPIQNKLKPIAYDQHRIIRKSNELIGEKWYLDPDQSYWNWKATFFEDKEFYEEYLKALERISDADYVSTFRKAMQSDFQRAQKIVFKDNPNVSIAYWKLIEMNAENIRRKLSPRKLCDAYINDNKIEVINVHSLPISVNSIKIDGIDRLPKNSGLIAAAVPFRKPQTLTLDILNDSIEVDSAMVECNLPGIGFRQIEEAKRFSGSFVDDDYVSGEFIKTLFFIDEESKSVSFNKAEVVIDKSVRIPKEYSLKVTAGQTIKLEGDGHLTISGEAQFDGEKGKQITVSGSGSNTIIFEGDETRLRYVNFIQLGISPEESIVRGAVSIYESNISVAHCSFFQNHSEDALHIVRSQFTIDSCYFDQIRLDALDTDFSNGSINSSSFLQVGNDGVDVSGSQVEMRNLNINRFGDKGISVGEKSTVMVRDCTIMNGKTGIASKDSSVVSIEAVKFTNCEYHLAIYQKKPMYGPARIELKAGVDIKADKIMIEEGSIMKTGDKIVQGDKKSLRTIFN